MSIWKYKEKSLDTRENPGMNPSRNVSTPGTGAADEEWKPSLLVLFIRVVTVKREETRKLTEGASGNGCRDFRRKEHCQPRTKCPLYNLVLLHREPEARGEDLRYRESARLPCPSGTR